MPTVIDGKSRILNVAFAHMICIRDVSLSLPYMPFINVEHKNPAVIQCGYTVFLFCETETHKHFDSPTENPLSA